MQLLFHGIAILYLLSMEVTFSFVSSFLDFLTFVILTYCMYFVIVFVMVLTVLDVHFELGNDEVKQKVCLWTYQCMSGLLSELCVVI